jgi:predicted DNA-binding transcriptional regulator AlpA
MKHKKKELYQRILELEQTVLALQQSDKKEKWLDAHDVKKLLNISDSTLWRYRKENKIPYRLVGNKLVYPESFFSKSLTQKIVNAHLL